MTVSQVPFTFLGNLGFASLEGIEVNSSNPIAGGQSLIASSTFWGVGRGMVDDYADTMRVQDSTFLGNVNNIVPGSEGIWSDLAPANMQYSNLTIAGFQYGLLAPYRGTNTIDGGTFNNTINIDVEPALDVTLPNSSQRLLTINNVTFGTLPAAARHGLAQVDVAMNTQLGGNPTLGQVIGGGWFPNLFEKDRILINGGELYFPFQAPGYVVSGTHIPGVDGRTNAQLWASYKIALGGEVAPAASTPPVRLQGGLFGAAQPDLPGLLFLVAYVQPRGSLLDVVYSDTVQPSIHLHSYARLARGWNLVPVRDSLQNARTLLAYY